MPNIALFRATLRSDSNPASAMRLHSRGRFSLKRLRARLRPRARHAFDRALRAPRAAVIEFVFGWNRGLGDIALGLVPLFLRIRARDPRRAHRSLHARRPRASLRARRRATRSTSCPALRARTAGRRRAAARRRCAAARRRVRRSRSHALARWTAPGVSAASCAGAAQWNALADALVPRRARHRHHRCARELRDRAVLRLRQGLARRALGRRCSRGFRASRRALAALRQRGDAAFAQRQRRRPARPDRPSSSCLSIVRKRCRILVAPDSGVLTAAYYLDDDVPARRDLAVVRPAAGHPQARLPLAEPAAAPRRARRARDEDVRNIAVDDVAAALERAIARRAARHAPPHMLRRIDPPSRARAALARRRALRARIFALLQFSARRLGMHLSRAGRRHRPHLYPLDRVRPRARVRAVAQRSARSSPTRSPFRVPTAYLWVAIARVGRLVGGVVDLVDRIPRTRGRDRHGDRMGACHGGRSSTSPRARARPSARSVTTAAGHAASLLSLLAIHAVLLRAGARSREDARAPARRRGRVLDLARPRRPAAAAAARAAPARLRHRAAAPSRASTVAVRAAARRGARDREPHDLGRVRRWDSWSRPRSRRGAGARRLARAPQALDRASCSCCWSSLAVLFVDAAHAARAHRPSCRTTSVAKAIADDPRFALWQHTFERIRERPWTGLRLRQVDPAQELHAELRRSDARARAQPVRQPVAANGRDRRRWRCCAMLAALAWRYAAFLRARRRHARGDRPHRARDARDVRHEEPDGRLPGPARRARSSGRSMRC